VHVCKQFLIQYKFTKLKTTYLTLYVSFTAKRSESDCSYSRASELVHSLVLYAKGEAILSRLNFS